MTQATHRLTKNHAERVPDAVRATPTPRERERVREATQQVIKRRRKVLEELAKR